MQPLALFHLSIVDLGGCELNSAPICYIFILQAAPDHLPCLQTCKNRPFSDLNEDKLHIIPSE